MSSAFNPDEAAVKFYQSCSELDADLVKASEVLAAKYIDDVPRSGELLTLLVGEMILHLPK